MTMRSQSWPVVPICARQRRDCRVEDLVAGADGTPALYRTCDVYRGGGGYDQFPVIAKHRLGVDVGRRQFVVQLRGCPLRCQYCYVTPDGVWGEPVHVCTADLLAAFRASGCRTLHLMGGAPALYLDAWPAVAEQLRNGEVLHSDFLLLEGEYNETVLRRLAALGNSLHAVSVKAANADEFVRATGVRLTTDMVKLMTSNLDKLVASGLPFYFTFTGMTAEAREAVSAAIAKRYGADVLADSFAINLVKYRALG